MNLGADSKPNKPFTLATISRIETWSDVARFFLKICFPLIVLAGISIEFFDSEIAEYFKVRYGNPLHLWSRATTDIGMAGPYFGISAALFLLFFLMFRISRSENWRDARQKALFAFLSLATGGIIAQFLKHLIGRKRPYADSTLSSHEFFPFTADYESHSMPSGHSQLLFSLASIFTVIWPKAWWLWMGAAAMFAFTRIVTLNHWASDVLTGAAVGMFGTVLTLRLLKYRKTPSRLNAFFGFAILTASVFSSGVCRADTVAPLGLGLVIGDPTGLSANYRMSDQRSVDGGLAWSFGSYPGFEIHSDYLWHRSGIFKPGKFNFDLHYGIGGRLISVSDRNTNDRTYFGPRLPVGIGTNFNQAALEVFAEIALVMNLIPSTTADLDFGLGARVYF